MAPFNQNAELTGLTSYAVAIPNAGPIAADWKLSRPTVVGGGGQSSVVMTVVNGTGPVTVYTGTAGAIGGSLNTLCAAGDVLTFTLSSAASADQPLNVIKCNIQVAQGVS